MSKREKPWDESKARDRYVRGEQISFRSLAKISGRHQGTLSRWSKEDPDGTWDVQRERYHKNLRTATDRKQIQHVSEAIGAEMGKLAYEHYKLHRQAGGLAALYIDTRTKLLIEAQAQGLVALVKKMETVINPITFNYMSQILDRHIKGERVAAGLEYEDLNKAIAAVTRAGFEVSEKSDDENTTAEDESQD